MATYDAAYLNTQKTTGSGTKPLFEPVINRFVLENAKEKLVFNQFGQKVTVPKGKTKTIAWDKCEPLPVSTEALTEGVTPEGTELKMSRITTEPTQHGRYVATSDEFDFYKYDPSPEVLRLAKKLSDNAAQTFDLLTQKKLAAGTNVQYAGGRSSLSAVTAADKFSVAEVRKAVRTLKKNKAERFGDSYICIIDADMAYDLMSDEKWENVKIRDPKDLYAGEIGELYGVRFVCSTQDLSESEAASGGVSVHCAYFLGENAYGSTSEKGNIETFWENKGSGGTADPLHQRSTAGWKGHHAARILTEGWMVRCLCAVSA